MKIVISPAKSLDLESQLPVDTFSEAQFLSQSKQLNQVLRQQKPIDLSDLMKISAKLAELNWERNQNWSLPFTTANARQAVFMFSGDVYTGLDAYTLSPSNISNMQSSLRILSGLYGLLKPLDLIQPYRLEMGTKFGVGSSKNLYEFWKETVTNHLNAELEEDELFINLASNEYFKAVDAKKLKVPVITPIFKDWKNDKLKIISFYAKKARGTMSRYLIENSIETLDGVKNFAIDGYAFSEAETVNENEPVFVR